MKKLGKITGQNLLDAWSIAEIIQLSKEVHSKYAPNRLEKWYRYSSNLQSIDYAKDRIVLKEEPHQRIAALGNRLYPSWHSLLVCGGDTTIDWHRDHGHFEAKAVMLNLGVANYYEQPIRDFPEFKMYTLNDGDILEINTKLVHKAKQVSEVHYNFTYRKIKPKFLASA